MIFNVNEIVSNKIKEMEDKGTVNKLLEDNIQKAITGGIEEALDSYTIKRMIEDKLKKEISSVFSELDFSSYNTFIAEKMKDIVESTCKEDVAKKIEKTFNDILVVKRDNIKLSEILERYRDWICENVDSDEKYDLENFKVKFEEEEHHWWLTIKMAKENLDRYHYDDTYLEFTIHRNEKDEDKEGFNTGWISNVYFNNRELDKSLNLGRLSEIESLIANIYYNKTPIIIDVEDECAVDSSFDLEY